jgi:hypothetical protein
MKLGFMQPYFFPYLGYFDLINYVDKWVVFDTVQYIKGGWIKRNRILHPNKGWKYITVPIKQYSHDTAIKDIKIDNEQYWERKIVGQLSHYRNKAPYAADVIALVEDALDVNEDFISRLNVYALDIVCKRLGINFDYSFFSEMALDIGPVEDPGDWSLRLSEVLGVDEYANPPGGKDLFDKEAFADSGIKLTIRNLPTFQYDCGDYDFIPDLSIVDVMMWNKPEVIKAYLDEHKEGA